MSFSKKNDRWWIFFANTRTTVFDMISKCIFRENKFFEKIQRFETFSKTLVRWVLERISTSTGVCEKRMCSRKILVQEFRNRVNVRFLLQFVFPKIEIYCIGDKTAIRHKEIAYMQWYRNKCNNILSRNTSSSKHSSLLWIIYHISCIWTCWVLTIDYKNTKREKT